MRVIDIDNGSAVEVAQDEARRLRRWVQDGNLSDVSGVPLAWEDVLDCEGDVCVDEAGFAQVLEVLEGTA